jgi:hypothetical protein
VDGNRRIGVAPLPNHLDEELNNAQLSGLEKVEGYGWSLKYVRRAVVVLMHEDGVTLGILEKDGTLNHEAVIQERAEIGSHPQRPKSKKFIV